MVSFASAFDSLGGHGVVGARRQIGVVARMGGLVRHGALGARCSGRVMFGFWTPARQKNYPINFFIIFVYYSSK